MNIKTLVSQGKLEEAINLLPDEDNTNILLLSRLNRVKKNKQRGVISDDDYNREINKLACSILSNVTDGVDNVVVIGRVERVASGSSYMSLEEMYKKYSRRNPQFAENILNVISMKSTYNTKKNIIVGYDPLNKELRALQTEEALLYREDTRQSGILRENVVNDIKKYLEGIPSYESLTSAWHLAEGLGMTSSYIPRALDNKLNSDEVRVRIAEEIERFL